ncbi:MAG TPA: site-specific integrase [Acidimicrobiales bacterium]|nr:site-specific integrase [Acidimicrobiales bacterium]
MQGTMSEIRPGVWRLRVYAGRRANGTPLQITKTVRANEARPGAGRRIAERELAAMVAQVSKGNVSAGTGTLGELLDAWLAHIEPDRSPTTMRKYRDIADRVVRPELGKIKLKVLTARQLDGLYAKLTAKGNKPATVRRVHALIGAALHQAERWDMVEVNVARKASPPPVHQQQVHAPSPDQVRALVAAAEKVEPALATLLLIGALTGARRGELCALRWSDVDTEGRTLTIARSVYETAGGGWAEKGTKTHQVRTISLDDFALAVLAKHRGEVGELAARLGLQVRNDGFVFSRSPVGAEPIRPDIVSKFTQAVAKAAGVSTHLHALRHFSATQAIAAGFDPTTVAGRLGHRDSSITLRVYSHVLERRDRDLAHALGRTLALPS